MKAILQDFVEVPTVDVVVAVAVAVVIYIARILYLARPIEFAHVYERHSRVRVEEHAPWSSRVLSTFFFRTILGNLFVMTPLFKLVQEWNTKRLKALDQPDSKKNIDWFIHAYGVKSEDIEKPIAEYSSLNEFVARYPKQGTRSIVSPEDDRVAVFPCDCRVMVFNSADDEKKLFIKGTRFSIPRLLDNDQLAGEFENCQIAKCRLTPSDVHHFYSPVSGSIEEIYHTGTWMLDLGRWAHSSWVDTQTQCTRQVFVIKSHEFGKIAMIVIGGSMADSVNLIVKEGQQLKKGEEIGFFKYGESNITLLFHENSMKFDEDVIAYSRDSKEVKVQYGDSLGHATCFVQPVKVPAEIQRN